MDIPRDAVRKAAAAGELVIRLQVDQSLPGGLAIYGKRFGRYPLDPTLVFVRQTLSGGVAVRTDVQAKRWLSLLTAADGRGERLTTAEASAGAIPVGVVFREETIARKGFFGDNWCQTWAADDNIYTMLDDRNGWWGEPIKTKEFPGWWGSQKETEATFGETDPGAFFFYKEDPRWTIDRDAYAFNWIAFAQSGRDNSAARDDYVYMYAPEQHDPKRLNVARVDRRHIRDRSRYEYFEAWNGDRPAWTKDLKRRGVNLEYPARRSDGEWMWASWFPDVVYNKGLDRYIMVSYGVSDEGKKFWDGWCVSCAYPASLGFWHARDPWGPWTQFHYTEYFYADRKANRTYGFKLSAKWMSGDGRRMTLIWSDAGDDHSTNYRWKPDGDRDRDLLILTKRPTAVMRTTLTVSRIGGDRIRDGLYPGRARDCGCV